MRELFSHPDIDRTEVILNVVSIFMGVLVVTAGLEVALITGILSDGVSEKKWCSGPDHRMQFHPVYGWTEVPNSQYLIRANGEWDLYTHNDQGFRDNYDSGSNDVIVLGDSFTHGSLASDNGTYPYLLDRWSPNTTYHNYGTSAYGTAQELLVYRNVSERIDHDTVVLGYYMGNDMMDNVGRGNNFAVGPQFELRNGTLVQSQYPQNPSNKSNNPSSSDAGGGLISGPPQAVQDFLGENTETYSYLSPKIRSLLIVSGIIPRPESATPPDGEQLAEMRSLTRALLNEVASEARENNATVVIAVIPTRGDVDPSNPAVYPIEEGQSYWNAQYETLRAVSENNSNVEIVDLKPALQNEVENGRTVYGSHHLNEYGYRIAAQQIYNNLISLGLIEDSNPDLDRDYTRDWSGCP